jgi:hypothetical protein
MAVQEICCRILFTSSFHLMNKMSEFNIDAFSSVYEVNVSKFFKFLNNVKLYTLLNASTLNPDHKINNFYFI